MGKFYNLQACSNGLWGGGDHVTPKDIVTGPSNYIEQNDCLKILIE